MPINFSNAKNRDAVIPFEGVRPKREIRWVDPEMRQVTSRKILKTDVKHGLQEIINIVSSEEQSLADVATALIDSDPELDIEKFGMFLTETSRIYVSQDGIVHAVDEYEAIYTPDGDLKENRPRKKEPQNINTEMPVRWTGKFIEKSDAIKRFVFTGKKQLLHSNGLTYDFLFDIARELHEKNSLMLIRAGEKGNRPIILHRGGKPYNAFLEGRILDDGYCLILHLSNLELKKPVSGQEDAEK